MEQVSGIAQASEIASRPTVSYSQQNNRDGQEGWNASREIGLKLLTLPGVTWLVVESLLLLGRLIQQLEIVIEGGRFPAERIHPTSGRVLGFQEESHLTRTALETVALPVRTEEQIRRGSPARRAPSVKELQRPVLFHVDVRPGKIAPELQAALNKKRKVSLKFTSRILGNHTGSWLIRFDQVGEKVKIVRRNGKIEKIRKDSKDRERKIRLFNRSSPGRCCYERRDERRRKFLSSLSLSLLSHTHTGNLNNITREREEGGWVLLPGIPCQLFRSAAPPARHRGDRAKRRSLGCIAGTPVEPNLVMMMNPPDPMILPDRCEPKQDQKKNGYTLCWNLFFLVRVVGTNMTKKKKKQSWSIWTHTPDVTCGLLRTRSTKVEEEDIIYCWQQSALPSCSTPHHGNVALEKWPEEEKKKHTPKYVWEGEYLPPWVRWQTREPTPLWANILLAPLQIHLTPPFLNGWWIQKEKKYWLIIHPLWFF